MSNSVSLFYWNDQMGKSIPRRLILSYKITAAKTVSPIVSNSIALTGFDSTTYTQAIIDAFLGTTNEFLTIAFDSTAMGTDAFAAVINMNGQAKQLVAAKIKTFSGTNGATVVSEGVIATAPLTASSLTTQAAIGASGNLAVRAILAGVDALTSGIIELEVDYISK